MIEHKAVLDTCARLTDRGVPVTCLHPGEDGVVTPASVRHAIRDDTRLVSIMAADNETGTLKPKLSSWPRGTVVICLLTCLAAGVICLLGSAVHPALHGAAAVLTGAGYGLLYPVVQTWAVNASAEEDRHAALTWFVVPTSSASSASPQWEDGCSWRPAGALSSGSWRRW
ncbi:aminotransferase class V-fold PLP-dependent enzyme [Stenotrophomonas lacuserhaii]|uniref:aminotransferase class V-fold PLP-dependent enzyme n=1 Tax=Stenotrophomonas lacuserhaii TaxID=2760084 RepID=UPI001C724923|nr:aminotransferase class V-fold PLP-dependent enzyme [Stenotrophomonas lacuserhaii]